MNLAQDKVPKPRVFARFAKQYRFAERFGQHLNAEVRRLPGCAQSYCDGLASGYCGARFVAGSGASSLHLKSANI